MRDLVVYPSQRQGRQVLGVLLFAALVLGLLAATIYLVVTTGDWPLLGAAVILVIAALGFARSVQQKIAHRPADGRPVLVVDASGIGDGALRIPWGDVAAVQTTIAQLRSQMPSLGRTITHSLTKSAGGDGRRIHGRGVAPARRTLVESARSGA